MYLPPPARAARHLVRPWPGRIGAPVQNEAMEPPRSTPGAATLDERRALVVTAVRALEQSDTARTLVSDEDRAWAGHAAGESLGAAASDEDYVARRAELLHERVGMRHPAWP